MILPSTINSLFESCDATVMLIEFLIGLLNIVAFTSWYIQLELILPGGLCPAHKEIEQWPSRYHIQSNTTFFDKFMRRPSIFWLDHSPTFIRIVGIIGILNGFVICSLPFYSYSILILCITYITNAMFYMSYISISDDFLMLQNDSEMVELNLLMFFCSFIRFRYPFITIIAFRWLCFRIMMGCGICKWFGAASWKQLTAMTRHYVTQPLPNPMSFYLHHLSDYTHKLSVIGTLIIEGPLCFGIFGPSCVRYLTFFGFEGLLLIINISGNFGYIGQLMMTETMSLLDDSVLPMFMVRTAHNMKEEYLLGSTHWFWYEWITIPCACAVILLYTIASWCPLTETLRNSSYSLPINNDIRRLSRRFRRFRFGNKYAKFGSMNEERYEFIIEGSNDLNTWETYQFLYKPSRIRDTPSLCMLHLPRLDWRMWFLPLHWKRNLSYNNSYYQPPPWFKRMVQLLHDNDLKVLKLIKYNPFPIQPPKHIRCIVKKFDFVHQINDNIWYEEMLMTNRLVTISKT
eukprot:34645_1